MCDRPDAALIVTAAGAVRRVDQCMRALVQALNDAGVRTFDCCCGHGVRWGHVTIERRDAERARALGFRVCEDAGSSVCYPFAGDVEGQVNIILPPPPDIAALATLGAASHMSKP